MVKEMKNEFEEDRKKMKQVQKAKHNLFQASTLWSLLVLFGPKVIRMSIGMILKTKAAVVQCTYWTRP